MSEDADQRTLKDEITRLEVLLASFRAKLDDNPPASTPTSKPDTYFPSTQTIQDISTTQQPLTHNILLLADSALPLGSFAFSSGLESYLAHLSPSVSRSQSFPSFLSFSLISLATTALPYLLAVNRFPTRLAELDRELDACILCPVARRASVAQGKALLTIWEKAFRTTAVSENGGRYGTRREARAALDDFGKAIRLGMKPAMKTSDNNCNLTVVEELESAVGHFPVLWGAVTSGLGVQETESAYLFFLNHAKAIISAAVRASVMGPYQAQGLLASEWLREEINKVMGKPFWNRSILEAGQGAIMCDFWIGRHEMLYSRIFNS